MKEKILQVIKSVLDLVTLPVRSLSNPDVVAAVAALGAIGFATWALADWSWIIARIFIAIILGLVAWDASR